MIKIYAVICGFAMSLTATSAMADKGVSENVDARLHSSGYYPVKLNRSTLAIPTFYKLLASRSAGKGAKSLARIAFTISDSLCGADDFSPRCYPANDIIISTYESAEDAARNTRHLASTNRSRLRSVEAMAGLEVYRYELLVEVNGETAHDDLCVDVVAIENYKISVLGKDCELISEILEHSDIRF